MEPRTRRGDGAAGCYPRSPRFRTLERSPDRIARCDAEDAGALGNRPSSGPTRRSARWRRRRSDGEGERQLTRVLDRIRAASPTRVMPPTPISVPKPSRSPTTAHPLGHDAAQHRGGLESESTRTMRRSSRSTAKMPQRDQPGRCRGSSEPPSADIRQGEMATIGKYATLGAGLESKLAVVAGSWGRPGKPGASKIGGSLSGGRQRCVGDAHPRWHAGGCIDLGQGWVRGRRCRGGMVETAAAFGRLTPCGPPHDRFAPEVHAPAMTHLSTRDCGAPDHACWSDAESGADDSGATWWDATRPRPATSSPATSIRTIPAMTARQAG